MIRIAILIIVILTTSCAYIPTPKCEEPKSEILELCNEPSKTSEEDTFEQRHMILMSDRQSLSECRLKHQALIDILNSCNAREKNYNALKDGMN